MISPDDVHEVSRRLREAFSDAEQAIASLGLKDSYADGEGHRYPDKQLVRRIWSLDEPGSEAIPELEQPNYTGLSALVDLLDKHSQGMKKGFWTILGELLGEELEQGQVVNLRPDKVEKFFRDHDGWLRKPLDDGWADRVVDAAKQVTDFPWTIERDGPNLKFTKDT